MKVNIQIDINSLSEKSKLLVKHLKKEEYFFIEKYPIAEIHINGVKKLSKNNYTAISKATIKGITGDVQIKFKIIDPVTNTIEGIALVDREFFHIGESNKSKGITKMVEVKFKINLNNNI